MRDVDEIISRIESRLEALQLKAATASKRAGLSPDGIRNIQRAKDDPKRKGVNATTIRKLAPVLHTTEAWLMTGVHEPNSFDDDAPRERRVPVVGYVGAGSETHFYAVAQGDLDDVAAPDWATDRTVAVEIRGESLGALFDRWLVFYDDVRSPVTSDLVGQICVVGLVDDRVLVKKIKRAKRGLFDLISNNEPPIEAVSLSWAARVLGMQPR